MADMLCQKINAAGILIANMKFLSIGNVPIYMPTSTLFLSLSFVI